MALVFTGLGGLFTQIGKILKVAYLLDQYENSLPAVWTQLQAQFATTTPPQIAPTVVNAPTVIQADTLTRLASQIMSFAGLPGAPALAQSMIIAAVQTDQPSQAANILVALQEFIRQMKAQGVTVKANVITTTPTLLSGTVGNGVILLSTQRGDGLVLENTVAETLRTVCTVDSFSGGATAGQETFGIAGAPVTGGVWDYDYPTGSGTATVFGVASADVSQNTQSNLLNNSNFETWSTAPTPILQNWVLETGVWGTDVKQDATHPFRGLYDLQFLPTGANVSIYQPFTNSASGTSVTPVPQFSYGVNLWIRRLTGAVTGTLQVQLVDGTDTVTQDTQGNNNSFSINLATLTANYAAFNGVFRLSQTPPTTLRLRLFMSVGLAAGSILVDDLVMTPMTPVYSGGPSLAVFTGNTYFAGGDGWSIVNTNDQGGATFCSTFQTGFDRLFGMKGLGLLLPSASPGTISNGLITA